jgi:hypothetical protein
MKAAVADDQAAQRESEGTSPERASARRRSRLPGAPDRPGETFEEGRLDYELSGWAAGS